MEAERTPERKCKTLPRANERDRKVGIHVYRDHTYSIASIRAVLVFFFNVLYDLN